MAFTQIKHGMRTRIGSLVISCKTPGLCCKCWLSIINVSCTALGVKQSVLQKNINLMTVIISMIMS